MIKFLFILSLIACLVLVGVYTIVSSKEKLKPTVQVSLPIPTSITQQAVVTTPLSSTLKIKDKVKAELGGIGGTYGVAVKDLKRNATYHENEHIPFEAASLYKLWVMAVAYQQIQSGKLSEGEILTGDASGFSYEFGDFATPGESGGSYTVKDALKQMITVSDNYSAYLLSNKIGLSSITDFLDKNGFRESYIEVDNPTTTAYDVSLFFEKLYKGQLANKTNTDKMLSLLRDQQLNGGIPKYLPEGILVAHKTGDINSFTHDAGIVYGTKRDYIIVVLTNSGEKKNVQEEIANFSKAIYNYFLN
ncbi:MAG TPA: serine hydrolase [Patescibacteria group bacterium]